MVSFLISDNNFAPKISCLCRRLGNELAEVEANRERAMSRARMMRSGHVYVISNIGSFGEEICKIGMTRRLDPMDRVIELGDASVSFRFDVHAIIYAEDAPSLENRLHKKFQDRQINKVNYRKEFFKVSLKDGKPCENFTVKLNLHYWRGR